MARKYLQFQGDRVFYSNANGDANGNWQEFKDPSIKGIFNVAQTFGDNPILQNSNFSPNDANAIVGATMFSSSEFTQYFIGQPIGVPIVTPAPPTPIIISNEAQIILNKFDNGNYLIPSGVNAGIELVRNGSVSSELFVTTFNNLLKTKLITDKTITPTPPTPTPTPTPTPIPIPAPVITYCVNVYTLDSGGNILSNHYDSINVTKFQQLINEKKYVFLCEDGIIPTEQQVREFYGFTAPVEDSSINSMMVSQSVGAFILKDGKLKGEILYIANNTFNPFYYKKNLTSLVQIKSKSGIPIAVKPNVLNFTNTERDERIQINQEVGNFKELIVDFYVWKSNTDARAFSADKQIQVVEELPPPNEPDFKPCQIGYHKDFNGNCVPDDPPGKLPKDKLIDTLKGFLFGTIALSLLARKY